MNDLEALVDWKAFAIAPPTKAQLATQDRVLPTDEAQALIEEASGKCHALIKEARGTCRALFGMKMAPHMMTWRPTVQLAHEACKMIEAEWLSSLDDMLALGTIQEKSTLELKNQLATLQPKCQELEELIATLKAALMRAKRSQSA